MTWDSLKEGQRRTVEIIDGLPFGRIASLWIINGLPCYDRPHRIVRDIKLTAEPEPQPHRARPDVTLKKEFETLFDLLANVCDGTVDIETRHSLPFKLTVYRGRGGVDSVTNQNRNSRSCPCPVAGGGR